jgi:hypothetical protein
MNLSIAYLANGKLHLRPAQAAAQTVESEFGQSLQERMLSSQRRNAWKQDGIIETQVRSPGHLREQQALEVYFTSLCPGAAGQLFYALEAGNVSGVFAFDPAQQKEWRLFHGSEIKVQYLAFHADRDRIACSVFHSDGTANIGLMPLDGAKPRDITEGDSLDLAPRWLPGANAVVFQSAGIGRDRNGFVCEQGAFTLEKIDFDRQEVTTIAADPQYDFLGPQMTADGTLYYIRRPYRSRRGIKPLHLIRDLLLMPFRLAYAVFQFLNAFTNIFTGKPMLLVGQNRRVNLKPMRIWGSWLDPATLRHDRANAENRALVPNSWQLIRQRSGQEPEILGEGVLAFDVAIDGSVVYSNGSAVYGIEAGGAAHRVLVDKLIEQVAFI